MCAAPALLRYVDCNSQDNGAIAPTNPGVDRVMCYVRGDFDGPVLVQKQFLSTQASVSARLSLATEATADIVHSFHFHEYGDLDNVGDIWQYSQVNVGLCCTSVVVVFRCSFR